MRFRRRFLLRLLCMLLFCPPAFQSVAAEPGMQTLSAVTKPVAAPAFELMDLDGRPQKLADYLGKVVVLNFWATWCPPCREEMPAMQRGWEKVRDEDIVFLGVNVGEDADTVFLFLADYSVDFPLLLDKDAAVIVQYPVTGLPTTYIIDPQGRITHRAVGGRAWDDDVLLNRLRALRSPKKSQNP